MRRSAKQIKQALAAAVLAAVNLTGSEAQTSDDSSIHFMRGIGILTGTIGGCTMMGGMSGYADSRVAFLRTELGITETQKPVWEAYAAALKKHLNSMLEVQKTIMQVLEAKTPVERMTSYIKAMDGRIASLKDLEPSLTALCSALSSDQQKKSDEVLTGMGCTM